MATTVEIAAQLLDRLCLDAGSKTNQQLSVPHTLEQLCLLPEDAAPALRFLEERALVNRFGPEIIYLAARGVQANEESWALDRLDPIARHEDDEEEEPPEEEALAGEPAEEDDRPAAPILTHIDLDGEQYSISLGWVCSIGRAPDNNVHISDKRASKHHAVLRYEDGHYVLEDKDSANGTLLNGTYLTEPRRLEHNDEIVIGRTLLLFQEPATMADPGGLPPEELLSEGPARLAGRSQPPTERPHFQLNPSGEASVPPSSSSAESIPPFPPPDSEAAGLPSFSPAGPASTPAFDPFEAQTPDPPEESVTPGTDPSLVAGTVPRPIRAPIEAEDSAPTPPRMRAPRDDPDQTIPNPPASIPEGLQIPRTHTLDVDAATPAPADPQEQEPTHADAVRPTGSEELLRVAESMPEATPDLGEAPADPPLRLPPDFADDPFFLTLRTIRSQLPEELHNRQGLIDAIDLLVQHPFVQIVIERLSED